MNQQAPTTAGDDDMPAEIDFSKGQPGKFHRPGTRLALPVYLDDQVQATLAALASAKGGGPVPPDQRPAAQGHRADRVGALSNEITARSHASAAWLHPVRVRWPSCWVISRPST